MSNTNHPAHQPSLALISTTFFKNNYLFFWLLKRNYNSNTFRFLCGSSYPINRHTKLEVMAFFFAEITLSALFLNEPFVMPKK